jgi:nucleotide-binding universal stress UspA family protein
MFEKILLLLDGSELAEAAVPYTRDLASQLGAEIFVLHACPPEHQSYQHMHQIYLNSIADGLRRSLQTQEQTAGVPQVNDDVIIGDPAKVILDYIQQKNINLVISTTHGLSGIRQWAVGSVADKVIRSVGIPSLLIRVKDEQDVREPRGKIRKILLPLDASDTSKIAVPYAVELARKLKAGLTLFSMAQTAYAQSLDLGGADSASTGMP